MAELFRQLNAFSVCRAVYGDLMATDRTLTVTDDDVRSHYVAVCEVLTSRMM